MVRIVAFIAASALATVAFAADPVGTAGQTSGKVYISHNGGDYVEMQPGESIMAGDKVMVPAGASASVSFGDGCSMPVSPGTVVTVPSTSTCAGGQASTQSIDANASAGIGSATGVQSIPFGVIAGFLGAVEAYTVGNNEGQPKSP